MKHEVEPLASASDPDHPYWSRAGIAKGRAMPSGHREAGMTRATNSDIGHLITSPAIRNKAKLRPLRSAKRAVSPAGTTYTIASGFRRSATR